MTALNADEKAQWDKILEEASLQLVQVIIRHSERKTFELERLEKYLRTNPEISPTEELELKEYESRKEECITHQKIKKLQRDDIPIPDNLTAESLSEQAREYSEIRLEMKVPDSKHPMLSTCRTCHS